MQTSANQVNQNLSQEPYPPTEKLSVKDWWWRLYYHGEVQISKKWYGTPNNFEKELPYEIIMDAITEEHPYYYKNRKFKSEFNDEEKKETFGYNRVKLDVHVAKTLKIDTIAIWTPVFEYLIKQIPNAYMFDGNELFEEFFAIRVAKGKYTASKAYLAGCVPNNDQLFTTKRQNSFVKYLLNYPSYERKVLKENNLTREERLAILFPKRRTINSFAKDNITVCLDFFANETSEVKKFINLSDQIGIAPSYIQLEDNISVSIQRKDNKFDPIITKIKESYPFMFFQGDKVTVIPYGGFDNHPIMEYLKRNIDIAELDVPQIIENYLEENIPSKIEL